MAEAWEQRGVKRVRQACINCRRKKTRCPGEKPECSFCVRLHQECKYNDEEPPAPTWSAYLQNSVNLGDLAARIVQIESKLDDMSRNMQSGIPESSGPFSLAELRQTPRTTSLAMSYSPGTQLAIGTSASEPWPAIISFGELPKATLDRAIDDYFRYSHNQLYSFFHEETFRRKLAEGAIPDFLLEAVIVSALRFSNDHYFDSDSSRANNRKAIADALARKSWKYIASKYVDGEEECSVSAVQAVTLLAIFEYIEGRQRGAWVKIGIAARFAQDLRLMFEPAQSIPFCQQEEYRRSFWSVYLLDRLVTCGRARPPIFSDTNITVQLPCSEESFKGSLWEQTEKLEAYVSNRVLQFPQPSPFARVIITAALLGRCSQYVIQAQCGPDDSPPWDAKSDYASINSCLLYLETHIDLQQSILEIMTAVIPDDQPESDSAEHLVVSQVLHHLCYCILNHYFLLQQRLACNWTALPASFQISSLQAGLYHAQELNKVLKYALEAGHMVMSSFLSYACLVSATVHAVYRHSDIASVRDQAIQDLNFNLSFLQRQSRYWPNAVAMLNHFLAFCQHSLAYKDLITVTSEPVNVSPADANRLYTLTDYCTLSTRKDSATWLPTSHLENLPTNRPVETSDDFVLVDTFAAGMDAQNNLDLTIFRNLDE